MALRLTSTCATWLVPLTLAFLLQLYAVHPYRNVGLYTQRDLGVTSFNNRRFKGDTGWSEDLMVRKYLAGWFAHLGVQLCLRATLLQCNLVARGLLFLNISFFFDMLLSDGGSTCARTVSVNTAA